MANVRAPGGVVAPTGDLEYWVNLGGGGDLYPTTGFGASSATAGDAIWHALGIEPIESVVVIITRVVWKTAGGADLLTITELDGAGVYTLNNPTPGGVGPLQQSAELNIPMRGGFKASQAGTTASRVHFKIMLMDDASSLVPPGQ